VGSPVPGNPLLRFRSSDPSSNRPSTDGSSSNHAPPEAPNALSDPAAKGRADHETASDGALDPADPETRSLLIDWLAFQRSMALRPQLAVRAYRDNPSPRTALLAAQRLVRSPARSRMSDAKRSHGPPNSDRAAPTPRAGLDGADRGGDADSELRALSRAEAVAIPVDSSLYPEPLAALSDPALLLLVRGRPEVLRRPTVAIVGSRAATVYGKKVARRIAADLAAAGVAVVSGLARGIDAQAHEGALEGGGVTLAVLACGIDRVYPAEHSDLARRIAIDGAVIGELPLGTPPRRPFFPMRNRLISGLSSAVVVVEARERSGTLITATHAANQGRDVFAVPGPITAPTSAGTNRLLRDGAYVALGAEDVLRELGIESLSASAIAKPTRKLGDGEVSILEALEDQPASRDELGQRLDRAPEQLALDLLELELDGRLAEDRDGRLSIVDLPD
jgi:DNA processing protein